MEICAWPGRFISVAREIIQAEVSAWTHHGRAWQRGYYPGGPSIIVRFWVSGGLLPGQAWICSLWASRGCLPRPCMDMQLFSIERRLHPGWSFGMQCMSLRKVPARTKTKMQLLASRRSYIRTMQASVGGIAGIKDKAVSICRRVPARRKPLNAVISSYWACKAVTIFVNHYTRI